MAVSCGGGPPPFTVVLHLVGGSPPLRTEPRCKKRMVQWLLAFVVAPAFTAILRGVGGFPPVRWSPDLMAASRICNGHPLCWWFAALIAVTRVLCDAVCTSRFNASMRPPLYRKFVVMSDARSLKRYRRARCDELSDELKAAEARVVEDTARVHEIKLELDRLTGKRRPADDHPDDEDDYPMVEVECHLMPVKAGLKCVKDRETQTGERCPRCVCSPNEGVVSESHTVPQEKFIGPLLPKYVAEDDLWPNQEWFDDPDWKEFDDSDCKDWTAVPTSAVPYRAVPKWGAEKRSRSRSEDWPDNKVQKR